MSLNNEVKFSKLLLGTIAVISVGQYEIFLANDGRWYFMFWTFV